MKSRMRIIDRYVIREVMWPFVIGLLVFTFMLIIPFLIEYAETFISKGVAIPVVLRIMATLLPQALALTIPQFAAALISQVSACIRLARRDRFAYS